LFEGLKHAVGDVFGKSHLHLFLRTYRLSPTLYNTYLHTSVF